jgi:mono/diheme cytochrome c family protein
MKKVMPIMIAMFMVLVMAPLVVGDSHEKAQVDDKTAMETAKASFEEYCGKCHGLDRPLGKQKDKDGWEKTVDRMSGYHKRLGDRIPEDAEDTIVKYLVDVAGK